MCGNHAQVCVELSTMNSSPNKRENKQSLCATQTTNSQGNITGNIRTHQCTTLVQFKARAIRVAKEEELERGSVPTANRHSILVPYWCVQWTRGTSEGLKYKWLKYKATQHEQMLKTKDVISRNLAVSDGSTKTKNCQHVTNDWQARWAVTIRIRFNRMCYEKPCL